MTHSSWRVLAAIRGRDQATLTRRAYGEIYGPTKGDLVRLADTSLLAEIEHDHATHGHELLVGAGKNLRDR
jgi:urease subunit alpha